jgi:hypothetical protein
VVLFTVAIAVLLLLQIPPGDAFARFEVYPRHTLLLPVMAGGIELTVTTEIAAQLVPRI